MPRPDCPKPRQRADRGTRLYQEAANRWTTNAPIAGKVERIYYLDFIAPLHRTALRISSRKHSTPARLAPPPKVVHLSKTV